MSGESHGSGVFSKFFHHNNHNEHGEKPEISEEPSGTKTKSETTKLGDDLKKEGKKFEDYIHEDEDLEEEGKTYGGLM